MKDSPSNLSLHVTRMLENLSIAVLLFDHELRLLSINPAAENLFEISSRQALGHAMSELVVEAGSFLADMRRSLDTGHPYTEREVHMQLPGDREVTVDCTVTPLLEPRQPRLLMVEMTQVDRHLRITREEQLLSQHLAARNLVRGLAHEIKNPLGGLRGAAQLLERELPEEGLREYTRIIIHEADRLQTLVNRLLGPNSLPDIRELNIHEVLEHVRSLVGAECPPEITLQRDYDPSIPNLHADAGMLTQAVLNIVRNAVQALGDSGHILLRTRTQRQSTIGQRRYKLVIRVDIIDDGPGIPADMREQIFYPMVTGRAEGTGLGLSIAQSLVNQHGGLIECTSRPGHTEFTLLIPLENGDG